MTTRPAQDLLERTSNTAHAQCIVCGWAADGGLGLSFRLRSNGSVEAKFAGSPRYQGYENILHGGVVSSLLDGAMTNCLFAHGIVAVTAEMIIRFRHPTAASLPLVVRAHIGRSQSPLHIVEAEIVQEGQVKAKAQGKFLERESGAGPFAVERREDHGTGEDA